MYVCMYMRTVFLPVFCVFRTLREDYGCEGV